MGNRNHAEHFSSFKYDDVENSSESMTGNSKTITNAAVRANSFILIHHTSIPVGRWRVVCSNGSFVITSSDAENAATFKYRIL